MSPQNINSSTQVKLSKHNVLLFRFLFLHLTWAFAYGKTFLLWISPPTWTLLQRGKPICVSGWAALWRNCDVFPGKPKLQETQDKASKWWEIISSSGNPAIQNHLLWIHVFQEPQSDSLFPSCSCQPQTRGKALWLSCRGKGNWERSVANVSGAFWGRFHQSLRRDSECSKLTKAKIATCLAPCKIAFADLVTLESVRISVPSV